MSTDQFSSSPSVFSHQSVLLSQSIQALNICSGGVYVDTTLGGGGHTLAMFQEQKDIRVYGIDRDSNAISAAQKRLQPFLSQCSFLHGGFADQLETIQESVDGIFMDLGVSSPQLDQAHRGFSFSKEGPLDMRMDTRQETTAATLINHIEEKKLRDLIFRYGEEPRARRIARAIVQNRPFQTTLPLAECIRIASGYKNSRTHPATRTFQALRITVNQELDQLQKALPLALSLLKQQGRLAIITFHSLEDRIVKKFFQKSMGKNTPKDAYGHPITPPQAKGIHFKGLTGKEHDASNPRARSARLRVIEKLAS